MNADKNPWTTYRWRSGRCPYAWKHCRCRELEREYLLEPRLWFVEEQTLLQLTFGYNQRGRNRMTRSVWYSICPHEGSFPVTNTKLAYITDPAKRNHGPFGPLITSFFFPSLFSYSFCTTIKWETYALSLSLWFLKLTATFYVRIRRGRRLHKNVIAISQRPNQKEPRAKRKSTRLQNLSSVQLASHRL